MLRIQMRAAKEVRICLCRGLDPRRLPPYSGISFFWNENYFERTVFSICWQSLALFSLEIFVPFFNSKHALLQFSSTLFCFISQDEKLFFFSTDLANLWLIWDPSITHGGGLSPKFSSIQFFHLRVLYIF